MESNLLQLLYKFLPYLTGKGQVGPGGMNGGAAGGPGDGGAGGGAGGAAGGGAGEKDEGYGDFLKKAIGAGIASTGWGSVGTLGLGAIQTIVGLRKLNELNKRPVPNYSIGPELQKAYGMAEQRATQGFMPTEVAQFQQGLARTLEAQRRNAISMGGGGLSQAISGALGGQALKSQNQFAAQDADRRLQNERYLGSMAGQMTNQRNLISGQDISYYKGAQAALGGAIKAGTTNLGSAFNAAGMGAQEGLDYANKIKEGYDKETKDLPESEKPSFGDWFKKKYG